MSGAEVELNEQPSKASKIAAGLLLLIGMVLPFGFFLPSIFSAPANPQIEACEQALLAKLKAPSTYKRIKADGIAIESREPPYYSVSIHYDAANSYGTPIRGTEICAYEFGKNGRPTLQELSLSDLFVSDADALGGATQTSLGGAEAAGPVSDSALPLEQKANDGEAATSAGREGRPHTEQFQDNCYKDYCPCEPPQGGPDQLICDQLEEGLPVDVELMISGRAMREGRRQLSEWEASN